MKKKLLLTGAQGYVGTYLLAVLQSSPYFEVVPFEGDITSPTLALPKVDVVIHLAGKLNSFKGLPDELFKINLGGTKNLARKGTYSQFVFLSSEMVFPSDATKIYRPSDRPSPETDYGRSKADAEEFLLKEIGRDRVTIVRVTMVYGYLHSKRKNFFSFLQEKLSQGEGESVELYTDVFTSPVHIGDLCRVLKHLIEEDMTGIYHTVGTEYKSRYELGRLYAELNQYPTDLLIPKAKPPEAKIPRFLHLQTSACLENFITTSLHQGLAQYERNLLGFHKEHGHD